MLHRAAGFRNLTGEQLQDDSNVCLLEWGELAVKLDAAAADQQTVNLTTHIDARDPLPEIEINQYWSDRNEDVPVAAFPYHHVPPMQETSLSRSVPAEQGGSVSVSAATVNLLPGDRQSLTLGPLSDKQREQLDRTRDWFNQRGADE